MRTPEQRQLIHERLRAEMEEEASIVALAKQRTPEGIVAFGTLYEKTREQVALRVSRLISNPADVEELVQNTYENAFKAVDRFEPKVPFRIWVTTIATNKALDLIKRQSLPMHPQTVSKLPDSFSPDDTEVESITEIRRQIVKEIIEELSPRNKIAVIAHYIYGKTTEQIANEEGVKKTAITNRLNRARGKILQALIKRGITEF